MDSTSSKSSSPKSGSQSQPSIMIQKMKETIEQTLPINKIPRPISSSSSQSSRKSNRKSSWHIANTSSIQNQQQLLILLFHARTCPETNNCCPIAGSQCNEAKRMWKHIAEECRDKYNCSHCYTSRYVLTHYRECRDGESCLICSPVREEIKRRKQLQLQQQQQIMKTADTFSTSMMTPSTTGITTAKVNNVHSMSNNNNNNMGGDTTTNNYEAEGNNNGGNNNNAAAATGEGGGENQKLFPTLTVAICPSADNPFGKIIPVRKSSFSSCSSLSHSTTYSALSRGSSSGNIPSSIRSVTRSGSAGVGGGNGGGGRTKPYFVKDRENPGIAHFLGKD